MNPEGRALTLPMPGKYMKLKPATDALRKSLRVILFLAMILHSIIGVLRKLSRLTRTLANSIASYAFAGKHLPAPIQSYLLEEHKSCIFLKE